MKSLNELVEKLCKPKYESYKQISNHVTLIDNFFEDFEAARDFFINREKWKSTSYLGYSKPGYESLLPPWVGKFLIEKYILDNKVINNKNYYDTECNFLYHNYVAWDLSNSHHFPHIDDVENDGALDQICLINLNKLSVSTKFYTYKNKEYCSREMVDEWSEYNINIENKIIEYYDNKDYITRDEVKLFLDTQKLDTELIKTIEYKPNQAIVYSANLFHTSNITQEFTEDNPRCLLRIIFKKNV